MQHVLPGHRAFSYYAEADSRVDIKALRNLVGLQLPTNPNEQNATWYRLFKTVESVPAVYQVHRDYLFTRDYTALSALFLIFYGVAGLWTIHGFLLKLLYIGFLIFQYLVVRQSAAHYGARMVTTVLAQAAANSSIKRNTKPIL